MITMRRRKSGGHCRTGMPYLVGILTEEDGQMDLRFHGRWSGFRAGVLAGMALTAIPATAAGAEGEGPTQSLACQLAQMKAGNFGGECSCEQTARKSLVTGWKCRVGAPVGTPGAPGTTLPTPRTVGRPLPADNGIALPRGPQPPAAAPAAAFEFHLLAPEGISIGMPIERAAADLQARGYAPSGCGYSVERRGGWQTRVNFGVDASKRQCASAGPVRRLSVHYTRQELPPNRKLLADAERQAGSPPTKCMDKSEDELRCSWENPPNARGVKRVLLRVHRVPEMPGGRVMVDLDASGR